MPSPSPTRSHSFTLEAEDLAAFHKHVILKSPVFNRRKWVGTLLPPLVCFGAWWLYVRSQDNPTEAAEKLWWLLLYIPIHFYLYPRRWLQKVAGLDTQLLEDCKKSKLLGRRRVVLSAGGIQEHNPLSEIESPWSKVLNVENNALATFVFLAPNAAIIIPQRSFDTPEAYADFTGELRKLFEAARGATPQA